MAPAPLVGRRRELERIDRLVAALGEGRTDAIVLVGEAGIGKTALADRAAEQARRVGATITIGRAVPVTIEQPLQPVLAALGRIVEPAEAAARSVIEATVGDPVSLLLQRTLGRIDALDGRTLLVLEDLHWADPATLTLVHHLTTRADARRLCLVATSRPPLPGTPLHHLLAGIDEAVIALDGLDHRDVESLATQRLGRPPGSALASLLAGSGGNPLLVEAMLDSLESAGALVQETAAVDVRSHAGWSATGAIEAQIASLPPATLEVLQYAAVVGPVFWIDLLVGLTGRRATDLLGVVDPARAAGVVRRDDGSLAFRHDLHRAAVLATLPDSARAAIHLDIAAELQRLEADQLDVAEHLARGARPGNRSAVAQLVTTAANIVDRDPASALRVSELALALVGQPDLPVELKVVRVAALAACGHAAEAELLGQALLRTPLSADVEARVRRDLALAAFVDGRPDAAATHMIRAAAIAPNPQAAAKARAELAWAQFLGLDHRSAAEGAAIGVADGDEGIRIAARSLQCWLGLWHLDIDAAVQAADAVEATASITAAGEWQVFQPYLCVAAVRLETGDLIAARRAIDAGRAMATRAGSSWAVPAYDATAAAVDLACGDLDAAVVAATAALDATALLDGMGVEVWSRSLLAQIAVRRGDLDAAGRHVEAAKLAASEGRAQLGLDHLVIAEADLLGARGCHDDALAVLAAGWDLLSAVGVLYIRAAVGAAFLRAAARVGDTARSAEIAAQLADDAHRAGLPALRVHAACGRMWTEGLPAVGDAVAAAAATGRPLLELDTLADAAAVADRVDPGAMQRFRRSADEIAHRLGIGPGSPARRRRSARSVRPAFGPGSLTDAEQRVAMLVAEGLTNAQIAGRLVVSRRTVDTQVLAAYRKLGVSSRVALTRLMLEQPADALDGTP
jgi:DNA-binding CsgD family transcriptional regulator